MGKVESNGVKHPTNSGITNVAKSASIRLTGVWGITAAFIVLLGILAVASWITNETSKAAQWVAHTYEVSSSLQKVLSVLDDAETGQRGYLLTGKEAYLEPFVLAIDQIDAMVAQLRVLTSDNPRQQKTIDRIEPLIVDKIDELKQTIELQQANSFDAALDIVRSDQGKLIMDRIRGLIAEMESEENGLRTVRQHELARVTTLTIIGEGIGIVFLIGIAVIVVFRISHALNLRRRAEEALKESEEKFKAIVDNSPTGITIRDRQGKYILANKTYAGWVHADEADILGKTVFNFFPKQQARDAKQADQQVLADGKMSRLEVKRSFGGGVKLDLLSHKIPIQIGPGQETAVMTIMTDLTEIRDTKAALRQSQKMEAVGQLTGGVAHDFNNLLAVISGNLELVSIQSNLDDQTRKRLRRAMAAVDTGAKLTSQLLTFSHQQTLNPKTIALNALLFDTISLLMRTLGEDIDIKTAFDANIPLIKVDSGVLGNSILNMANNARDAMPKGGTLTIKTSSVDLDGEFFDEDQSPLTGPHVLISVADTGMGIKKADLEHVFEPFFTTKDVGKGSGLGLAMVHGFVKQSGGHMTIKSEIAKGTTIHLYFPASTESLEMETVENAAKAETEPKGTETILVVEDDKDVRLVTVTMLSLLGYKVLEAEDGPSALKILKSDDHGIDLVFSDVVMPSGMSGYDLAKELRRNYPEIKVILTSGYPEKVIKTDGIDDTGITLYRKPFKKIQLAQAVRTALHQ